MKMLPFILFVSIFLLLYGSLNYYIYRWALKLLPDGVWFQNGFKFLFVLVALSFIAGRLLERTGFVLVSNGLEWVGSFWFGAMVYFFFFFLTCDLARGLFYILPQFKASVLSLFPQAKEALGVIAILVTAGLLVTGFFNALNIRIRSLEWEIRKAAGVRKELRLILVSDIHLGVIVGKTRFNRLVDLINERKPDIVLLAGDILDEDLGPVIRENLGESLCRLSAPLGVYACLGNHEYIGGIEASDPYLRNHNIRLLRDEVSLVDGAFYVAGRDDRSGVRFSGQERKSLKELLTQVDKSKPVILLDHQPANLKEAAENGVDVQLSGHTHNGQFWPINLITRMVFEKSYGYLKKGDTHIYVSSGAGTWGPPIRLSAAPEIVEIQLRFSSAD